jgi:hypothetical protein
VKYCPQCGKLIHLGMGSAVVCGMFPLCVDETKSQEVEPSEPTTDQDLGSSGAGPVAPVGSTSCGSEPDRIRQNLTHTVDHDSNHWIADCRTLLRMVNELTEANSRWTVLSRAMVAALKLIDSQSEAHDGWTRCDFHSERHYYPAEDGCGLCAMAAAKRALMECATIEGGRG